MFVLLVSLFISFISFTSFLYTFLLYTLNACGYNKSCPLKLNCKLRLVLALESKQEWTKNPKKFELGQSKQNIGAIC